MWHEVVGARRFLTTLRVTPNGPTFRVGLPEHDISYRVVSIRSRLDHRSLAQPSNRPHPRVRGIHVPHHDYASFRGHNRPLAGLRRIAPLRTRIVDRSCRQTVRRAGDCRRGSGPPVNACGNRELLGRKRIRRGDAGDFRLRFCAGNTEYVADLAITKLGDGTIDVRGVSGTWHGAAGTTLTVEGIADSNLALPLPGPPSQSPPPPSPPC